MTVDQYCLQNYLQIRNKMSLEFEIIFLFITTKSGKVKGVNTYVSLSIDRTIIFLIIYNVFPHQSCKLLPKPESLKDVSFVFFYLFVKNIIYMLHIIFNFL